MKKILVVLAAVMLLPLAISAQTYQAQSGVSLLTGVTASATHTSGAVRLPTFSGVGTLNITESGITGSPSGCSVALKYQQNNGTVATAAVATIAFTPATGTQQLAVVPTVPSGDNYVAVYNCSSTYPTAGLINVSFSPIPTNVLANFTGVGDPCKNPAAATSSIYFTGVTTITQEIALSAGKQVYLCQVAGDITSAGTFTVSYGTGTNCGTGTTVLAALTLAANTPFSIGWGGAIVTAPAGNAICITASAGTGAGILSYVQQ
jgi:hypothetical protein